MRRLTAPSLASKTPSRIPVTLVASTEEKASSATIGTATSVTIVNGSRSVARTSRTTSVRTRRAFTPRSSR
jgi:hypothetical protein